jgi:hypothetical protein
MKVEITYKEIQYFERVVEVEMTKKEYNKYIKMSHSQQDGEYNLCGGTGVEHWVATETLSIDVEIIK